MSNEERLRILRMVAEGKLAPAEADELLAALGPAPPAPTGAAATSPPPFVRRLGAPDATAQRYLVVRVVEDDQPKVNARIPLGRVRDAGWLNGLTEQFLSQYDFDLAGLVQSLGDAPADGAVIDLRHDETSVWIGVESAS